MGDLKGDWYISGYNIAALEWDCEDLELADRY